LARSERGTVVLGLAVAMVVHFTGLNTAIYYAPTILASSGLTPSGGLLGSILIGGFNLAAAVVAILCLDRLGRRPLMIGGLGAMAVAAAGVALAQVGLADPGVATALLLCAFIVAGAVGPAPIFWVFTAEIYPQPTRATLMSLATAAHWIADFLVATTFLPLTEKLSLGGAFAGYAGISAVAAVALWRYLPETRGRRLARADEPTLVAGS
jgi:MFS family permease